MTDTDSTSTQKSGHRNPFKTLFKGRSINGWKSNSILPSNDNDENDEHECDNNDKGFIGVIVLCLCFFVCYLNYSAIYLEHC